MEWDGYKMAFSAYPNLQMSVKVNETTFREPGRHHSSRLPIQAAETACLLTLW